jgi:hypothetical protein
MVRDSQPVLTLNSNLAAKRDQGLEFKMGRHIAIFLPASQVRGSASWCRSDGPHLSVLQVTAQLVGNSSNRDK